MAKKDNLHRSVFERFAERTEIPPTQTPDATPENDSNQHHLKRFLNMVDSRKLQLLEKILLVDE